MRCLRPRRRTVTSTSNGGRPASVSDYKDNLKLINSELTARLTRQETAGNQVGTKAALLAGVATAAAQFLATRQHLHMGLAVTAWAAYGLAFIAGVYAYALARYEDVPAPRKLVEGHVTQTESATLAALIATRVSVFEANKGRYRRKVVSWWISLVALALGLVVSVTAIVQTDHHGRPEHSAPANRASDVGT